MSLTSFSLVNQKLAYACALLTLIPASEREHHASPGLQNRALLDATVAHLVCAYQHYLRELAENFHIKLIASVKTERDLLSALAEQNKTPTEATELMQLCADEKSWLACLRRNYEQQWELPISPPKTKNIADEGIIVTVSLDSNLEATTASLRNVSTWHQAFVEMIQRHRETSAEY